MGGEKKPDLAKIALPLQIAGFAGIFIGWALHAPNVEGWSGIVHFIGDALFFFWVRARLREAAKCMLSSKS